jgi:hypothetical protein
LSIVPSALFRELLFLSGTLAPSLGIARLYYLTREELGQIHPASLLLMLGDRGYAGCWLRASSALGVADCYLVLPAQMDHLAAYVACPACSRWRWCP